MQEALGNEKRSAIIKKRIIQQAIILASEKGISGISIQNVAQHCNITKGGVFHHFPNKKILVETMINQIISHLDKAVDGLIKRDNLEYGKFTRAYINCVFLDEFDGLITPWSALSMMLVTDKTFNELWANWLNKNLIKHDKSDNFSELNIIRLAVDGLWLQKVKGVISEQNYLILKNSLLERTYS